MILIIIHFLIPGLLALMGLECNNVSYIVIGLLCVTTLPIWMYVSNNESYHIVEGLVTISIMPVLFALSMMLVTAPPSLFRLGITSSGMVNMANKPEDGVVIKWSSNSTTLNTTDCDDNDMIIIELIEKENINDISPEEVVPPININIGYELSIPILMGEAHGIEPLSLTFNNERSIGVLYTIYF